MTLQDLSQNLDVIALIAVIVVLIAALGFWPKEPEPDPKAMLHDAEAMRAALAAARRKRAPRHQDAGYLRDAHIAATNASLLASRRAER